MGEHTIHDIASYRLIYAPPPLPPAWINWKRANIFFHQFTVISLTIFLHGINDQSWWNDQSLLNNPKAEHKTLHYNQQGKVIRKKQPLLHSILTSSMPSISYELSIPSQNIKFCSAIIIFIMTNHYISHTNNNQLLL